MGDAEKDIVESARVSVESVLEVFWWLSGCTDLLQFSPEVLAMYTDHDPQLAREVAQVFIEEATEKHLPALEEAIKDKDAKKCFYHAHTLKGSSGYVGAEGVQWIAARIVYYSGKGQMEQLPPLIDNLKSELTATVKALNHYYFCPQTLQQQNQQTQIAPISLSQSSSLTETKSARFPTPAEPIIPQQGATEPATLSQASQQQQREQAPKDQR